MLSVEKHKTGDLLVCRDGTDKDLVSEYALVIESTDHCVSIFELTESRIWRKISHFSIYTLYEKFS